MDDSLTKIHPLLQDYIQCIQIIDVKLPQNDGMSVCQYPPTPQNSIFIYLKDRIRVKFDVKGDFHWQPEAVIVGPQVSRVIIDIGRHHKAVRIGFQPAGLYRFLGIPMYELVDQSFDAVDILGQEFRHVIQRLKHMGQPVEMKTEIENYFLHKIGTLKAARPFDLAVYRLLLQDGNMAMDDVAKNSYLSLRQFERVSRERLGFSPKLFARIARFSKAYRMKEQKEDVNWTEISYQCGYFDQMHLIKDFRVFAGLTPGIIEKEIRNAPALLQKPLQF